jgi:hypothetical protein
MRLRAKAAAQRDIEDVVFRAQQQLRYVFDPAAQQVVMRTQARRAPELRGEMHAGEAGASHCEGFEGETNRDAIYVAREA